MSLAAPYQEHYYIADGETTRFSFGEYFSAPASANVKCIIYFEDGTSCVPSFDVDTTTGYIDIITLITPDGQVLTAPPAGSSVRVFRDTPEQQNVTASQLQNYTAKQLEKIFDSIVAMIQEVSYSDKHKTVRLTETQRDVFLAFLKEANDDALLYWDNESRTIVPTDFVRQDIVRMSGGLFFRMKHDAKLRPYLEWSINGQTDWHSLNYWDASDTADEAKRIAEEAKEIAEDAKDVADDAKDVADEAKDIAEDAKEIAEGIEDIAEEAKDIANATADSLTDHIADKDNPHEVTKAQVGLGNVDNTADLDKPVIIKSSTIPTATVDLVGKEYQYFGETNGTYTHGFVYECSVITTPSSITASQTTGTSLSDIAVDIDTFESYVEPTTDTTLAFTYDNAQSEWIDAEENIVQLSDYGISYTGTPENNDVITVAYTAEAISYDWVRVNLQPVIDNLTSTSTTAALSANQGKVLNDRIDDVSGRGRYLSLWNCATGLAETNPPTSPYEYKAGDYFVVGTVSSADPAVNYKPDGSSYTTGTASTTVESNEVSVNDTYFYDGTVWKLQSNAQKEVSFSALAGSPYDNTNLSDALNSKANTTDIKNATITINQGGTQKGQFTLNQASDATIDLSDGQIIQVDTMPTASADNAGRIVQWIGVTDIYTNGYFYQCTSVTTPSSATVTADEGSDITDLEIDIDTFEAYVEPVEDKTMIFTYDGANWDLPHEQDVDLSNYGISYSGTPVQDETITLVYTMESTSYTWVEKLVQPRGVEATYDATTKTITFA